MPHMRRLFLCLSCLLAFARAQVELPPPKAPDVPELLAQLAGDDRERGFAALRQLATLGGDHRRDIAQALQQIAVDADADETWREYSAMGLGNMQPMPDPDRAELRAALRAALQRDGDDCPDGVLDLLVRLGDAAFVREVLGPALCGRRDEIAVLAALADAPSRERLLAILAEAPSRRAADYDRRCAVGRALLAHGDPLGIDVLVSLLPRQRAPGAQHRRNVLAIVAAALPGMPALPSGTDAQLDAAAAAVQAWWRLHREDPRLPPGTPSKQR